MSTLWKAVAACIAGILLAGAASAQETGVSAFEGRWIAEGEVHGFVGRLLPIDLVRCDANGSALCGREVSPETGCGREVLRLDTEDGPSAGGSYADGRSAGGYYALDLGPVDPDLDQSIDDGRMPVVAMLDNGRLQARFQPSGFFRMLSRSALDDVTVVFHRSGPPSCDAIS